MPPAAADTEYPSLVPGQAQTQISGMGKFHLKQALGRRGFFRTPHDSRNTSHLCSPMEACIHDASQAWPAQLMTFSEGGMETVFGKPT